MIKINATGDTTLHTAGTYCEEDILVKVPSAPEISLQNKEITENGTYSADEGFDGLGEVTVNVASSGGGDIDALIDGSITEVTSNATKVRSRMFEKCLSLTTANFSQATSIGEYAFYYDTALTEVDFAKATNIEKYAFTGCNVLARVNFPQVTIIREEVFSNCKALTEVNLPKIEEIGSYSFNRCDNIHKVDSCSLKTIKTNAFAYCYSLRTFILRSEELCALSNTAVFTECCHFHGKAISPYNPTGLKDGYFYVPRALIEDYKVATNWSTFATQFRALEDYTVDGTITGELDESKI